MAGECQGRRSPPAGAGRPASRLSLLVGLAESFSSSPATAPADGLSSRSPTARSPRSFDYEGAVGLGIVAAMNGGTPDPQAGATAIARTPRPVAPRRSEPILIVSARPQASGTRRKERRLEEEEEEEEMELSESYTCVISHVGGGAVSKRVYFDDGAADPWGCCPGVFFESPPPPRPALLPAAEDFLSRCFRCSKGLHDLDIFMYRGDKAFCSAECRCQQILSDERRGNWLPDALKTFDCSGSPCSTLLLFSAGVAAA